MLGLLEESIVGALVVCEVTSSDVTSLGIRAVS
jgi:hypothetical protein